MEERRYCDPLVVTDDGATHKLTRIGLAKSLTDRLQCFAAVHDFAQLYTEYEWRRDKWGAGFPDILKLEMQLTGSAKSNLVTSHDIVAVAEWANHRNIASIECPDTLRLPLHSAAPRAPSVAATDPAALATQLRHATKGLGPTTLSKVLRFAVPSQLGVIDTRIVRVVGRGDEASKREDWLSLRVRNYGSGAHIPASQSAWPRDYSKWVNILRLFAGLLNGSGVACPHPHGFVTNGLRSRGVWACADVEMALFAWASQSLKGKRSRCSAI